MTNREIADLFEKVADMLAIRGDQIHRILAYRWAAESIRDLSRDLNQIRAEGELTSVPGIGSTLAAKIEEMLDTGHDVIVNRCDVIPGDSGGPILLADPEGEHRVVGVVTNFWGAHGGKDFSSFGPASVYFADKIDVDISATSAP